MSGSTIPDGAHGWKVAALIGSLEQVLRAETAAAASGAAAWVTCFRLRRSLFESNWLPAPHPREVARFASADPAAAACAAVLGSRVAILQLDRDAAATWLALYADVATPQDPWLSVTRAWLSVCAGDRLADVVAQGETLAQEGRRCGDGQLVVEAAAVGAFALLELGERAAGLALARRASRMASAEGLGPLTALAHIVLSRARRASGHPHLGAHVASTLGSHLSTECGAWPAWEAVLGAGVTAPAPLAGGPPLELYGAIAAAATGRRDLLEQTVTRARAMSLPLFAQRDLDAALAVTDWSAAPGESVLWCDGRDATAPRGVEGLASSVDAEAYVLALPGQPGRRVLACGAALAAKECGAGVVAPEADQKRTDSAVAALLHAGPNGVETKRFFADLYGFALVERHAGVLRVLLHRVRRRVAPWATLVRDAGKLRLEHDVAVLFPDPRCERADHAVLTFAASQGQVVARDVAERLGVPLRTAQDALRRLAEVGVFRAVPSGRNVQYVLEDTTFGEPTRA